VPPRVAKHFSAKGALLTPSYLRYRDMINSALAKLKEMISMVQKSDAMLQHEKWIAWVLEHNPKGANDDVMHIEVRNLIVAAAVLMVILIVAAPMMGF
jgi:hypothetical protein